MFITKIERDDETLLKLSGKLDATEALVATKAVLDVVDAGKNVTLDLSEVTYVSSAGLRALLTGFKAAQARNLAMTIHSITPPVAQVLKMTGFDSIFPIAKN